MIGLSTSWLTEKEGMTGGRVIEEILDLGFRAVELEYRVTAEMFRDMVPLIVKANLRVLSVHNFFPLPADLASSRASGDLFLLSSPDDHERNRAVEYTVRTIQSAHDLGASAVVLHLGRVDMDPEHGRFAELFLNKTLDTPEGRHFRDSKVLERREKSKPYLEAVLRSLDHLTAKAAKLGIALGVENRYYYHEIPDFEEIGHILKRFSGGPLSYWHDMGHAYVQERLGFVQSGSLLQAYGTKLLGVHIHDAQGLDDHLAPGTGEIKWSNLKELIHQSAIKILEVHKKADRRQLCQGRELVERISLTYGQAF
jgi:sugar phosphate isomerase/epimerase